MRIVIAAVSCTVLSVVAVSGPRAQDHAPRFELPAPTGAHPLGTAVFQLKDESRDGNRELVAQVWYPADSSRGETAPYIPDPALIAAMKREEYNNIGTDVIDGWRNVRTHAVLDAPILTARGRLPLLFFSHGFGMSRSNYTSIIEDLASHGYIVVAIDHPYAGLSTLPDGRVLSFKDAPGGEDLELVNGLRIEAMGRDVSFTLDSMADPDREIGRFAGQLDLERTGMLGHSLGGAAALWTGEHDPRIKACVDLDGDLWGKMQAEGVGRPFLVMLNQPPEHRRPPVAMREQRDKGWADFIGRQDSTAYVVKIDSANHFSFTDFPFVVPEELMRSAGAEIAPQRGFEIITGILRAFFARHLNGEEGRALELFSEDQPEVTIRSFGR